jgi:hypothetical protein
MNCPCLAASLGVLAWLALPAAGAGAGALEEITVESRAPGTIIVNGHAATLAALKARLAKIGPARAVILYHRDPPDKEPTPDQQALFRALQDSHILISMSGGPLDPAR